MKALRKDFYMQIKRTFNRFVSIMLIVALGVSFYVGIRSTEPDMRLSADMDYDEGAMHDIRIVSTLGLTDEDVGAVDKIDKVELAEGAYNVDTTVMHGAKELTVKLMSYSEDINIPYIYEGKYTGKIGECMVDAQLADSFDIKIGDVISLSEENIAVSKFTVTGTYSVASYLSLSRGSTTVGTGTLDGLIMVSKEAFDLDVYTDIYALIEGAKEMNTYEEDYENLIEEVMDNIEESIAGARAEARYSEVIIEANEELESARKEFESGSKEYESGKKELESGKKEIEENESEMESAKEEISENESELESASREVDKGIKELESAKKEYESGKKELESAKKEIKKSEKEYNKGLSEFESGSREYESGKTLYDAGVAEYESGMAEYESGMAEYESGKAAYDAAVLVYGEEALKDTKAKLDATFTTLSTVKAQLDAAKSQLDINGETLKASEEGILEAKKEIEKGGKQLKKAKRKITKNEKKLDKAKKEIKSGVKEINKSKKDITEGFKKIEEAKTELADGEKELKKAKADIKEAENDLKEAEAELNDARIKLEDAKAEIEDIEKPEWYVMDRNYIQTYVEYDSNASRIGKIGAVFPMIFFMVAAMVSLTTMTRMVEEERTQIGTMKALGYGKLQTAFKYLAYGSLATMIGGLAGGYLGGKLFPYVIIVAYRIMFVNQRSICMPTDIGSFAIAIIAAFVCVVGATLMACFSELRAVPAQLMRPEAPKSGKRVLLERIPFIWNRLSFNMKSTFRNLFRYKKRLFMTLFGIGGCTALLLVGFGVRDSVHSIVPMQYGVVNKYDYAITYDSEEFVNGKAESAHKIYADEEAIYDYMEAKVFTADVKRKGKVVNVNVIIPESVEKMSKYISLQERVSGKKLALNDEGVIINEKLAMLFDIGEGDVISIKDGDTKTYEVKVVGISETYTLHYLYMTKNMYEKLYGKEYEVNTAYLDADENADAKMLSKVLMDCKEITGVSVTQEVKDTYIKSLTGMDAIVLLLIISAGGLAFVVLYNLNNINIAERKRELATLKVLGFYDGEVSGYVYRENVIITFMGIILGIVFGVILHYFIIVTAEVDDMMMGREIGMMSYVLSIILTVFFAVLINISMHFKLKKVDMATSLKSVE